MYRKWAISEQSTSGCYCFLTMASLLEQKRKFKLRITIQAIDMKCIKTWVFKNGVIFSLAKFSLVIFIPESMLTLK